MVRYEKRVVQTPKLTAIGILLNIIAIVLPIVGIILVWEKMEESAMKELLKVAMAAVDAICILHLVHRLVRNKIWFDINDPDYHTEYIELYEDHIVIYERAVTYSGHNYSYGEIYFDDIRLTMINDKTPKTVFKMHIYLNGNPGEKTKVKKESGRLDSFFVYMKGYPEELSYLLLTKYKSIMKVR